MEYFGLREGECCCVSLRRQGDNYPKSYSPPKAPNLTVRAETTHELNKTPIHDLLNILSSSQINGNACCCSGIALHA